MSDRKPHSSALPRSTSTTTTAVRKPAQKASKRPGAGKQTNSRSTVKTASASKTSAKVTAKTATKKTATKKTAAKKTTAQKSAAKKTATKKTAAKKTAAQKTATKKTAAQKTATKKTATKKTATKKTAAQKTTAKKTAANAKKTAAQKTTAKKTAAKKTAAKTKKTAAQKTTAKKAAKKQPRESRRPTRTKRPPLPPAPRLDAEVRGRLQALLLAADPQLNISDEAAAHAGGDALRERYNDDSWVMGTMWSDKLWAACGEASARLEQLAETAPRSAADFGDVKIASAFFVDVARPDTLFFAPNPEMPAVLFVEIPADVASVRAVLAEYAGDRERSVHLRAWMGFGSQLQIPNVYSGELGEVDDHELDRFFVFSPVASTISRRTYFSNSKFNYEQHGDDLFIWDLAWSPCTTSPKTVAAFNELTGYDFPLEMPVDLVAACEGFEFSTAEALEARITTEPENTAPIVTVLAAIGWRSFTTPAHLRRYIGGDIGVQGNLANAAFRYGWERLLWDILLATSHDELRGQISAALGECEFPELPSPPGERRVLAVDADLETLETLADARGWTEQPLPEGDRWTRAIYTLPGHTDESPRRLTWIDLPAFELSTLALENLPADDLAAVSATFPAATTTDKLRAAVTAAWLGDEDTLWPHLTDGLREEGSPASQVVARLVGLARITNAADILRDNLKNDEHAPTRKILEAALARVDPSYSPPLDKSQVPAAFETVLTDLGQKPATSRESADWWRFKVDGLEYQAGLKGDQFHVLACLCEVKDDADPAALSADLKTATQEVETNVRFKEEDGYLWVENRVPLTAANRRSLTEAVRDCHAATTSGAALRLTSRYREW